MTAMKILAAAAGLAVLSAATPPPAPPSAGPAAGLRRHTVSGIASAPPESIATKSRALGAALFRWMPISSARGVQSGAVRRRPHCKEAQPIGDASPQLGLTMNVLSLMAYSRRGPCMCGRYAESAEIAAIIYCSTRAAQFGRLVAPFSPSVAKLSHIPASPPGFVHGNNAMNGCRFRRHCS